MLGPNGAIEDEASAGIALMELMPRLLITDVGTVQAMLTELMGTEGLSKDGRKMLTMGLMFRWMTVQPESAIGFSLAHPALLEDSKEMNMLGLIYMAKARPDAAKGLAAMMPEDEREDVNKFLAKLEATSNPGGVLADPEKRAKMGGREAGSLAGRWMRSDPAAALAWFQALPMDQRTPEITSGIAAARMAQDPAATLSWLSTLPDGPAKDASRKSILDNAMDGVKDFTAMESKLTNFPTDWHDSARLQWLSKNPPTDASGQAQQLKAIFARDPAKAEHYTAKRAIQSIATNYTKSGDFAGGTAWAMTMPPGEPQAAATAAVVQAWTQKDPAAASTWVSDLPAGHTRDAAASSMINQIQKDDPSSALVWAQSISDGEKRRTQTRGVFQSWFKNQPFEALQSIQTLPAEEQQRIFAK